VRLAVVLCAALSWAGCSMTVGVPPPAGRTSQAPSTVEPPGEEHEPGADRPAAGGPGTLERIEEALEQGEIDEETALVYRVLAVFADPRLPEEYRGDDPRPLDRMIGAQLQQRFETLSAANQQRLAPYLLPPIYRGSWVDLRTGGGEPEETGAARSPPPCSGPPLKAWSFHGNERFKVWYPRDRSGFDSAARVVLETLANDAYPKLVALMGKEPLPDDGKPCNGGDERLDVYLIEPLTLPGAPASPYPEWGQTLPYSGSCSATPVFILLSVPPNLSSSWVDRPILRHMVVHETMHAIQFAYALKGPCLATRSELTWWTEATATWAEDFIYGNDFNPEHGFGEQYLQTAEIPIHEVSAGRYRGYLFPFYLAREFDPQVIRRSWEALEKRARPLEAIDHAIPGHFEQRWPELAVFNLNEPPVEHYRAWDSFGARLEPTAQLHLELAGQLRRRFELPSPEVPALALRAYRVSVGDDVRLLEFDNTWHDTGLERLRVQALVRRAGGELQPPKDWSGSRRKLFCRDRLEERVEELVLVVSYSEWEDLGSVAVPPEPPSLIASDAPCWRLHGSTEARTHKWLRTEDLTAESLEVIEADVVFERTQLDAPPGGLVGLWFQPVTGRLRATYEVTYTDHETGANVHCNAGPVERPLGEGDGRLLIWFNPWEERYEYLGFGNTPFAGIPVTCMDETSEYFSAGVWLGTAEEYRPLLTGGSLDGTFSKTGTGPDGTTTQSWEWRLVPERE
jgi:hypothetical protein